MFSIQSGSSPGPNAKPSSTFFFIRELKTPLLHLSLPGCHVKGPAGKTVLCVCFSTSRDHRRYFYVNDQTSASQWEFPSVKEEEEDTKPPQPSAVCQENAGQLSPEASSGLLGRCLT